MIYINIVTPDGVNKLCRYATAEAAARDILGDKFKHKISPEGQLNTVELKTINGVIRRYEHFHWCEFEDLANERFVALKRSYRWRWNG